MRILNRGNHDTPASTNTSQARHKKRRRRVDIERQIERQRQENAQVAASIGIPWYDPRQMRL